MHGITCILANCGFPAEIPCEIRFNNICRVLTPDSYSYKRGVAGTFKTVVLSRLTPTETRYTVHITCVARMGISYVYIIGLAVLAFFLRELSKVGRRPKDYPPGPPTWPIIGNIHLIPKERQHLQFQKWAEEYGPIYSLILGTKVMIVLSSDKTIKDLLDKRSNIYSSRPEMYLGNIVSGGFRMLLMVGGSRFQELSKLHRITELN